MTSLSAEEIERLLHLLLAKYVPPDMNPVSTDADDFYWTILSGDQFDFEREPEPAVGSLVYDVVRLRDVLTGEAPPTSVDLDRVAAVLRLLSARIA